MRAGKVSEHCGQILVRTDPSNLSLENPVSTSVEILMRARILSEHCGQILLRTDPSNLPLENPVFTSVEILMHAGIVSEHCGQKLKLQNVTRERDLMLRCSGCCGRGGRLTRRGCRWKSVRGAG